METGKKRLSAAALPYLARGTSILVPEHYDKNRQPTLVHLGSGAFHRCHLAEYSDDLLRQGVSNAAICAINLRPPALEPLLNHQDGLYCRQLRENGMGNRRIIAAIAQTHSVLGADYDPHRLTWQKALNLCLQASIHTITLTVTEKGYCYQPATGDIDWNNPDIEHDLHQPFLPKSVPGFLLALIRARHHLGIAPPTIVCCDNVPHNGATMHNSVLRLAERICPQDVPEIFDKTCFLNTMVDRIVPATRQSDIENFADESGFYDYALVVGEPFKMWVIENPRGRPLPPWQQAGALIVEDCLPYELLKMRIVNGIQSNLCQLGVLAVVEFMSDLLRDPLFLAFARQTAHREVAPHLPLIVGIDNTSYIEQTLQRLANRDLKHRNAQISTDGSQKIKQRLLEPMRAAIKSGTPYDGLALGVAGWIVHSSAAAWDGKKHVLHDPLAAQLDIIHQQSGGDVPQLVEAIFRIEPIFGSDFHQNKSLKAKIGSFVQALKTQPVRQVLQQFLNKM